MLLKKNILASLKLFTKKPINVKINDKIEFDIIAKEVAEKCGGTTFNVHKKRGAFEVFKIRDVGYDLNYEWEEKPQNYYESFLIRPAFDAKEVTFNVFKTSSGWIEIDAAVLHEPETSDAKKQLHLQQQVSELIKEISDSDEFYPFHEHKDVAEDCNITMSCSVDPPPKIPFNPPERTDIQDLKLYKQIYNIQHSDMVLIASDDIEVNTHSSILRKFSKVFEQKFNKSSKMPVKIREKEFDAATIQSCIDFYCGNKCGIFRHHFKAFHFAVKYEMAELKDFCLGIFEANVTEENVCELIQVAYKHDLKELKEICKKFLAENKSTFDAAILDKLPKNIIIDVFRV